MAGKALGERVFAKSYREGLLLPRTELWSALLDDDPAPDSPAAGHRVPPVQGGVGALTRREQQIAFLVAQGKSNREMAAELVISFRTVEGHVEHVLAKLGFRSRAEIASWAADQGAPR